MTETTEKDVTKSFAEKFPEIAELNSKDNCIMILEIETRERGSVAGILNPLFATNVIWRVVFTAKSGNQFGFRCKTHQEVNAFVKGIYIGAAK